MSAGRERQTVKIRTTTLGGLLEMCYADVYPNDDGTFSVSCYCGHCEHGFLTWSAADKAAREHQESQDNQVGADHEDEAASRGANQD